jgi:DNA-binding NtrC family response regulator
MVRTDEGGTVVDQGGRLRLGNRVLVVEEDEARRTLTAGALVRGGLQARGCESAEAALDAFGAFEPHLLLVDVDLGAGPDGLSLACSLARRAPRLFVLLMSGYERPVELPPSLRRRTRLMCLQEVVSAESLLGAVRSLLTVRAAALGV